MQLNFKPRKPQIREVDRIWARELFGDKADGLLTRHKGCWNILLTEENP
jgi:hypothetical protein